MSLPIGDFQNYKAGLSSYMQLATWQIAAQE